MKIAIVSANIGGMDTPKQFPVQEIPDWCKYEYFSFTDKNIPFPFHTLDSRIKAKYFKIKAHKLFSHDIIVWVDGNVQIKSPFFLANIVATLGLNDIAIAKHPERDCIYKEANFIVDGIRKHDKYLQARYKFHPIKQEADYFKEQGVPSEAGLYWCGLFARKNNNKVNAMFDDWWDDNIKWSNFDQNSFVYEVLKHKIDLAIMDWGNFNNNDVYERVSHLKIQ